jgi:hypothetical protein
MSMNKVAAAVVALSLSAPSLARAQEPPPPPPVAPPPPPPVMMVAPPPMIVEAPPSNGVGLLVAGGIFTGLGVLNLATAPLCKGLTSLSESGRNACFDASLIVGGLFLATGIPLLIVGGTKRSAYKEWKASHPMAAGLGFSAGKNAGTLTWKAEF